MKSKMVSDSGDTCLRMIRVPDHAALYECKLVWRKHGRFQVCAPGQMMAVSLFLRRQLAEQAINAELVDLNSAHGEQSLY